MLHTLRSASFVIGLITALGVMTPDTADAQTFTLTIEPTTISYNAASGVGSGTVEMKIVETDLAPGGAGSPTDGFSFSLSHDPGLFTIVSADAAGALAALDGGNGAFLQILNVFPDGLTGGVIYDAIGAEVLTFDVPRTVLAFEIDTVPSEWSGDFDGAIVEISTADPAQATVAVSSEIVIGTTSMPLARAYAPLEFAADAAGLIRGDANGDGNVAAISDAVTILNGLFVGLPILCLAAADVTADGGVNLADAITLLNYGFAGGPAPAAPFPGCGPESISTTLACDQSGC